MFNRYFSAGAAGLPSTLLQPQPPHRVAPDVVKMPPVRDQYAELSKVSERFSVDRSVLTPFSDMGKVRAE